MDWAQFKDPVSHMCLAGTVVASWSLTQEVAGWQVRALFTVMTNIYRLQCSCGKVMFSQASVILFTGHYDMGSNPTNARKSKWIKKAWLQG